MKEMMKMNDSLKTIQDMVFKEYQKNGYHSMWTDGFKNNNPKQSFFDLAELGLIHTEISEAMEEIRKPTNSDETYLMFECADIIIRTLNFMSRKGANAEYYILTKHAKNLKRGKLHGKQI